jgi:hypothetical protein
MAAMEGAQNLGLSTKDWLREVGQTEADIRRNEIILP